MSVLEKLALDELLFGKVLPHFQSISENVYDAIMRTERIIASLSGVWTGSSVVGDKRYDDCAFSSLDIFVITFVHPRTNCISACVSNLLLVYSEY